MPGVTTRNRLVKRASRALKALLATCQAISIAITTVLPLPVAIFTPRRGRPSLWRTFWGSIRVRKSGSPWRPAASAM